MRRVKFVWIRFERGKPFNRVVPGYVFVRRGQTISFENRTSGPVSIQFCQGRQYPLLEAGASWAVPIPRNAPAGCYAYSVFCHDQMKFAVAGSMPIIIVPKT